MMRKCQTILSEGIDDLRQIIGSIGHSCPDFDAYYASIEILKPLYISFLRPSTTFTQKQQLSI